MTNLQEVNTKLLPLFENEEIVEKLNACKSPEECYDVAKAYIPDISPEEFQESMSRLHTIMEESKSGYLNLDDLDDVSGGSDKDVVYGILAGAAVAGAAAAAAA